MPIRVALPQTVPATKDTAANLGTFDAAIARAAAQGADLVIFPELALTGYACGDAFFDVDESVPRPATEHLVGTARRHNLHIIWGMPERGLPGVLYNSAVLVRPQGHIGTWRKHTLPGHATG